MSSVGWSYAASNNSGFSAVSHPVIWGNGGFDEGQYQYDGRRYQYQTAFWSSSEYGYDEAYQWYIGGGSGSLKADLGHNPKSVQFYVRCVRPAP